MQVHIPRQGATQLHHFPMGATRGQLEAVAPAIFAQAANPARTKPTYQQVRTWDVISAMADEGWQVVAAGQKFTRNDPTNDSARHMVRLRRMDAATAESGVEFVPEAIMLNAHDGSAAWRFYTGAFRFVCSNGLVFGEMVQSLRLHHSLRQCGPAGALAHAQSLQLLAAMPQNLEMVERVRAIVLSEGQMHDYARAALAVRWVAPHPAPIVTDQLLAAPMLEADRGNAWGFFNHVQRHLVTQGGLAGQTATGRNTTSRGVTRVDELTRVNVGLWNAMLAVAGVQAPTITVPVAAPALPAPEAPAPEAAPAKAPKKAKAPKAAPAPADAPKAPKKARKGK